MGTGSFPGVEVAGAWGWPPTPFSAEGPTKEDSYISTHPKGLRGLYKGWKPANKHTDTAFALLQMSRVAIYNAKDGGLKI